MVFDSPLQADGVDTPDLGQFTVTGFSGPVDVLQVNYYAGGGGGIATPVVVVQINDGGGNAPFFMTYVPGGLGPLLSLVGTNGVPVDAFGPEEMLMM